MKSKAVLLLVLTGVSFLLLLQYLYYVSDLNSVPENVEYKTILYWTKMFDRDDFYFGFGSKIFEGCEVSNCYATNNRSYLPVDKFDAILFHGNEFLWDYYKIPENRSEDQYYIYSNQESPVYTPAWFGKSGFFNWTMTYRLDSDLLRPYGYYEKTTTNYRMPTTEEVQSKPHKIAWMVSNCEALSNRKDLYLKLSKYIPIDVYGSCGNHSCPKEQFEECHDLLAKNYLFYLSFENSICSEYVTEKLYAALMRDIVPIVYGGADYKKVAPPHSVIDVTKFSSVKELAKYINSLVKDPKKYLSYYEWKNKYVVRRDSKRTLCSMCKKLNEPIIAYKSYRDIDKWWKMDVCSFGNKLPKILFT